MTAIYRKLLSRFINHDVMHLTQVVLKKPGPNPNDATGLSKNSSKDTGESIFDEDGPVKCLALLTQNAIFFLVDDDDLTSGSKFEQLEYKLIKKIKLDTHSNFYIEFDLFPDPKFGNKLLIATEDRKGFVNNVQNCYKADLMARRLLTKGIPICRGEIEPVKKTQFPVPYYPFPMIHYPQDKLLKTKFKDDDTFFLEDLDNMKANGGKFRCEEVMEKIDKSENNNLDINKNKIIWLTDSLGTSYNFLVPSAIQKKSDNEDISIYYLFRDIVREQTVDI